jgi:FkbM family methyltransferase
MGRSLGSRWLDRFPKTLQWRLRAWRHWLVGELELHLLPFLVPQSSLALDIGANRGVYTYWLSQLASRVVAFEPIPPLAHYLKRVSPKNVTVVCTALSDRRGVSTLSIPESDGEASLRVMPNAPIVDEVQVPTLLLDDLDLQNVGFIKIDVEGSEASVLQGGRRTLTESHPVLLIEVEQRHHTAPITEVFQQVMELGYAGFFLADGRRHPIAEFDVAEHQWSKIDRREVAPEEYVNNFIFVPLRTRRLRSP